MRKRSMLKRVLAVLSAAVLTVGCFSGCGSKESGSAGGTGAGSDGFKIAVGLPDSGSTMFSLIANNVTTMVESMGGTVSFQGGVGASADATIQFVEEQIAAGANGIVLSPPSDSVLTTVTTMCEEAEVYWGITFRSIQDEEVKELVESSPYYIGHGFEDEEQAGYQVMSNMNDKGIKNVAIISLAKGNNTTDLREQGAQRACEEFGMSIVAEARDLTQASDATNAAESFLSAYSDLDAIFVVGTTGAGIHEAVAKAIEDAGKAEDVKLATIDFPDAMQELFEKEILVTCSGTPSWGYDPYVISTALVNTCKGTPISDSKLELEVPMYDINDAETAAKWLEKYGDAETLYYDETYITENLDKGANEALTEETLNEMIQEFTANTVE